MMLGLTLIEPESTRNVEEARSNPRRGYNQRNTLLGYLDP